MHNLSIFFLFFVWDILLGRISTGVFSYMLGEFLPRCWHNWLEALLSENDCITSPLFDGKPGVVREKGSLSAESQPLSPWHSGWGSGNFGTVWKNGMETRIKNSIQHLLYAVQPQSCTENIYFGHLYHQRLCVEDTSIGWGRQVFFI